MYEVQRNWFASYYEEEDMLAFIAGVAIGIVVGAYIVYNNRKKAFAILAKAKEQAEIELNKLKAKL